MLRNESDLFCALLRLCRRPKNFLHMKFRYFMSIRWFVLLLISIASSSAYMKKRERERLVCLTESWNYFCTLSKCKQSNLHDDDYIVMLKFRFRELAFITAISLLCTYLIRQIKSFVNYLLTNMIFFYMRFKQTNLLFSIPVDELQKVPKNNLWQYLPKLREKITVKQ